MKSPLIRFVLVLAAMGMVVAPAWSDITTTVALNASGATDFSFFEYDPAYSPPSLASLTCWVAKGANHDFSSDTIRITLTQDGFESTPLVFDGVFSGNSSLGPVYLTFSAPSQTIGETTYTIDPSPLLVDVGLSKVTDVTFFITTPEPSYFGALALGLLAFGFFRYRKSRTQTQASV